MSDSWVLRYEGLDREREDHREALCTLANGVFGTRGAAEEQRSNDIHYPGNYVAGGYNELVSEVAGRRVVNEDLVNFPNWLCLTFRPQGGKWLDLWQVEVLKYVQELDLKRGTLRRTFRICDDKGRITSFESLRLVHMDKHHLASLRWKVVAENWSGKVQIRAGLDGSVTNENVARYQQLENKHLNLVERGTVAPEGIYLKVRTNTSDIEMAQAARTRIFGLGESAKVRRRILQDHPERIAEELSFALEEGQEIGVEKTVAQFTSRDRAIGECGRAARMATDEAPDFDELLSSHIRAWERLWRRCDVEVDSADGVADPEHEQLVLRLHIFHLLQTASLNTVGRDVGIPARGLHGEAYRGHIFWDELFILPFYIQRFPSLARSAILYRYYRLDAARRLAHEAGCVGAAFPWQSGSDGGETTQELHLNPMDGTWDPDHSHLQRHINSAVVYNTWNYYEATGDRAFMEEFGAEIILEVARFWSSLAEKNADTGRYEIDGVMGPDEYHEKYPDADKGGLKNNVYTNITALWCLLRALDVLEIVSEERGGELRQMLEISEEEVDRWEEISRKMTVVFHDGVLSQFEGYDQLEEFDWAAYGEKFDNIERLDRILKAEGDTPDRYKVSKQADVTMLLYLFRPEELTSLFERLGYELSDDDILRNVQYYQARTSHGSTLSRVVYTSAVHRYSSEEGSRYFLAALESDLCDVQGGTTPEGVHLGAMGGTVDIVMRYYAGLEYWLDRVKFTPHMPRRIRRIRFHVKYQGRWLDVDLTGDRLAVTVDDASPEEVVIEVNGDVYRLGPGEELDVEIERPREVGQTLYPPEQDGEMAPPIDVKWA